MSQIRQGVISDGYAFVYTTFLVDILKICLQPKPPGTDMSHKNTTVSIALFKRFIWQENV